MKPRIILLALTFLLLISCQMLTGPGAGPQAGPADEYAVYTALIKAVYENDTIQTIVIQATTDVDKGMTGVDQLQRVQSELKGVTPAMVNDLSARSLQTLTLEPRFNLRAKVVLLTQAQIQAIFNQGGWKELYRQYPDSQGALILSRVGFNPAVDQALVYAGNESNPLAGAGFYYLLAKENGVWVIKQQLMMWVS